MFKLSWSESINKWRGHSPGNTFVFVYVNQPVPYVTERKPYHLHDPERVFPGVSSVLYVYRSCITFHSGRPRVYCTVENASVRGVGGSLDY